MPELYRGTKRRKYQKLVDELHGICYVTNRYQHFIKEEITLKPGKPRIITPHDPEFNVSFFPYIHGFEEMLLSFRDVDGTRFFAKGLNFDQRAAVLR